jgi:penicillin-binding protein 1A
MHPPLSHRKLPWKRVLWALGFLFFIGVTCTVLALILLYHRQPEITALVHYRPTQPLRVFTSDGVEIGNFGPERRHVLPLAQMPKQLQDALLAVEDRRFRMHSGVDIRGIFRALVSNTLSASRGQGGSTITQQVARNFYLARKKTYVRKINEILLAIKIENRLNKAQILELYMNQVFLGHQSYGFEAAAQTYLGKTVQALSLAECALLAGLPQNPTYANPVTHFDRAHQRQRWVLQAMHAQGLIDQAQFDQALAEPLQIKNQFELGLHAEHVADHVRQIVIGQYGDSAYVEGLKVVTTLHSRDQQVAYAALRRGLLAHTRSQPYRGPEGQEESIKNTAFEDAPLADLLAQYPDDKDLRVALVSQAYPEAVVASLLASGERIHIHGQGLQQVADALVPKRNASVHNASLRIKAGSIIRVAQDLPDPAQWAIRQWPQTQGALVALNPQNGHIAALVGGFDFLRNPFNYATATWREPGATFTPFLYAGLLEQGMMPSSIINGSELNHSTEFNSSTTDQSAAVSLAEPMTLRQAFVGHQTEAALKLLKVWGIPAARQWIKLFGFSPENHPIDSTLALGRGRTNPLELSQAYAVWANGGHRIQAQLIERITNAQGQMLFEAKPELLDQTTRVVSARHAFVMRSLLQESLRSALGARAQGTRWRPDLYGQTSLVNEANDAWCTGFQPTMLATVWLGDDAPGGLGPHVSANGATVTVWVDFMRHALQKTPVSKVQPAQGVLKVDGDWVYSESALGWQRGPGGLITQPTIEAQ